MPYSEGVADAHVRTTGESMTVHRLINIASALLCGCVLVMAGCGSPDSIPETSGIYPVSIDGKWGYIDNTGTIKIQPQYDSAQPFSESLAVVRLDGKWGYIDTSGTTVVQPQFDDAHPFSDGLAAVARFSGGGPLFGYIDTTGALVIPMRYAFPSDFSEGLCMVVVEENGTQTSGYIDKTGAIAIEPEFTSLHRRHRQSNLAGELAPPRFARRAATAM